MSGSLVFRVVVSEKEGDFAYIYGRKSRTPPYMG